MRIVDEIQHLLRLAEDPGASSAERDLAMRRAEKLMVRRRLQPDQLHQDGEIKTLSITVTGGARSVAPGVARGLCELAQALDCRGVFWPEKRSTRVMVAGEMADLARVNQFYASIMIQAPLSLRERMEGRQFWSDTDKQKFRRSYMQGFLYGVAARIKESTNQALDDNDPDAPPVEPGAQLVLSQRSDRAEDHLRELFPSIREAPAILQHAAGKLFGSTDGYASDLGSFTTRLEHQQRAIGSE
nr:MAG TPA: Protein of unknown function (DUF2786) [Bacteriophage sp.]